MQLTRLRRIIIKLLIFEFQLHWLINKRAKKTNKQRKKRFDSKNKRMTNGRKPLQTRISNPFPLHQVFSVLSQNYQMIINRLHIPNFWRKYISSLKRSGKLMKKMILPELLIATVYLINKKYIYFFQNIAFFPFTNHKMIFLFIQINV